VSLRLEAPQRTHLGCGANSWLNSATTGEGKKIGAVGGFQPTLQKSKKAREKGAGGRSGVFDVGRAKNHFPARRNAKSKKKLGCVSPKDKKNVGWVEGDTVVEKNMGGNSYKRREKNWVFRIGGGF